MNNDDTCGVVVVLQLQCQRHCNCIGINFYYYIPVEGIRINIHAAVGIYPK